MRTASMQFEILTADQAAAYLEGATRTAENHGDRIAAQRRLEPVSSEAERQAARDFARSVGR